MSEISESVLERIQLWDPGNRTTWPDWWRFDGGWYENDVENREYVTWPLTPESVVLDVGGYEGAWARRIVAKYNPFLHLFEPVPRAFDLAKGHLGTGGKVFLHHFAIGDEDKQVTFYDTDRDGAGVYSKGNPVLQLPMRQWAGVLKELEVEHIDLMSLNIEGGEYDLLPHMIDTGMGIIQRMMIQWHWRMDGDLERQQTLQNHLAHTHRMIWNYGAWEAWERKVKG